MDDPPSQQLETELRTSLIRALATRRPLLHHLNADTSWLLQIPRPASAIRHGSRIYYNILIDPWFVGGQSDVARWFSQQWHAEPSAVQSVAEVEDLIWRVEGLAGGSRKGRKRESVGRAEGETCIDLVAISHEFTDHCHKETLMDVHRDVPVFAADKAAKLITTFSHFRSIHEIPIFPRSTPDWRDFSIPPLPTWLSISRLTAPQDGLYYHSALLIAFNTAPFAFTPANTPARVTSRRSTSSMNGNGFLSSPTVDSSPQEEAEYVLYTPHGIPHSALTPLSLASPSLNCLAFLHGLHDVRIGSAQQLNLGAENGVRSQQILNAKYWVGTHDEVKRGGGLIGWFLRRKAWRVEDVVEKIKAEGEGDEFEDVRFVEVGNGESRVLE